MKVVADVLADTDGGVRVAESIGAGSAWSPSCLEAVGGGLAIEYLVSQVQ